jgi:hypothetical protein
MKDVWTSRQYYRFGTIEAQTIRKPIRTAFTSAGWWSSVPRTIMGIIFFGAHSVYFERLQGVLLADGLTSAREFGGLIDHLISEWENSNLLVCPTGIEEVYGAYGTDCDTDRQPYFWGKGALLLKVADYLIVLISEGQILVS